MAEAYIVAAARAAAAARGDVSQAGIRPISPLRAEFAGRSLRRRSRPDRRRIMGCRMQAGEQSTNIARNAVMASKLPESVPTLRSTASAACRSRRCISPRRP